MKKVLFFLAAMAASVASAQSASVCDSIVGGTTVNIPLASGFSPNSVPADRATELGLAVLTALPNGPNITTAVCVRYNDQVTAQVTLTCSSIYGMSTYCSATEVPGTRRSLTIALDSGDGGGGDPIPNYPVCTIQSFTPYGHWAITTVTGDGHSYVTEAFYVVDGYTANSNC